MRVVHIMPTITFGDGVSNDALQIQKLLMEHGIMSHIYAENIGAKVPAEIVHPIADLPKTDENDIIIYHGSQGTELNYRMETLKARRKIMVYHNITPGSFFAEYSENLERLVEEGYAGMRFLADKLDCCIADSAYNAEQLRAMGYQCQIEVCPILIPFSDYDTEPDQALIERLKADHFENFLFVGRITPNKKQEDVIRCFYYYHKYYNSQSRLILVGNYEGMESYYLRLLKYVYQLHLQDYVVFPGHISFREILAYYHAADAFLCMSEHEGFCIPVVEAMYFSIPVIAYRSTAVPETLGSGGLLTDSKDGPLVAAMMDRVIRDKDLRSWIKHKQQLRIESFRKAPELMWRYIEKLLS